MTAKAKVRIGRLTSVGMVGIEIGRLYRLARRGEIDTLEAFRLAQVLLGLSLETSAFEDRLAEMETAIAQRGTVEHLRPKVAA